MTIFSQQKFRKIINDLKRRPEDAARDLSLPLSKIENILNGKEKISLKIIEKAISVWPVNHSDFFSFTDDANNGFKILKFDESENSQRKMYRAGKPYYLYKDTVMSKVSPFRPEWIKQLVVVNDNDPNNEAVKFNNGHFLHQFTYFIGPVNFYYIENNVKKVAEMNSGDSMYISPYIPHTFTTRKNSEGINGCILALTFSDKIDGDTLNEISAIGYENAKKLRINLNDELNCFKSSLNFHFNNSFISKEHFKMITKFSIDDLNSINELPDFSILKAICDVLQIGLRDLLLTPLTATVKINKYSECSKWFYPSTQDKKYGIVQLTNIPELPFSKSFELNSLVDIENDITFQVSTHQYLYNIGDTSCRVIINEIFKENFAPGDSIYLKPGVKFKFIKKSKILILRTGGRVAGDAIFQISKLSEENFKRLMNDNSPWFNSN